MAGAIWSTRAHLAGFSLAACASLVAVSSLCAQELDVARVVDERNIEPMRELYQHGEYERVAEISRIFIERGQPSPEWWIFRLKACHELGRVDDLVKVSDEAAAKHPKELPVLITCHEVLTAWGKKEAATKILQQINAVAKTLPASQRTARDTVALGRAALAAGADPQKVIQ
ncbi:MAG TPA: hypothetical protein VLE43_15820, partial [Candidatus Saccharimonadia bacterium]|nr:hypothetical protein [Candidatus Saccharimonadia bacterium]